VGVFQGAISAGGNGVVGCLQNGTVLTCNVLPLAMGAQATLTISGTIGSEGVHTNTVTVTASEPDPVASNNSLTLQTRVVDCSPYCI
jgi:hypothetical protein